MLSRRRHREEVNYCHRDLPSGGLLQCKGRFTRIESIRQIHGRFKLCIKR